MNYLAHAYLSFNQPEILVGNMMSDFVKGKQQFTFSPGIQQGIQLHRAIDTFTDFHPATKQAKLFFKPAVGTYSGAFVDVAYDHFLANDATQFLAVSLQQTADNTYNTLNNFKEVLPPIFRQMLPYMTSQNWLYNYRTIKGIQNSFSGVVHRAAYLSSSVEVFKLFEQHYAGLHECYNNFFADVKEYAQQQLATLIKM